LAVGLPYSFRFVKGVAVLEACAGIVCLSLPWRWGFVAVSLMYAAFAGLVAYLLIRHIRVASCGCAGQIDIPPSWSHVTLNMAAVGVGIAGLIVGDAVPAVTTRIGAYSVLLWLSVLTAAYLSYLAFLRLHGASAIGGGGSSSGEERLFRAFDLTGGFQ